MYRNPNNTPVYFNVLNVESYFLHNAVIRSCTRPHASLCLVTVARQRPKLLQAVINISASDWLSSVWDGHFVLWVTRSIARAGSAECRYSQPEHMPTAFLSVASVCLMYAAANGLKIMSTIQRSLFKMNMRIIHDKHNLYNWKLHLINDLYRKTVVWQFRCFCDLCGFLMLEFNYYFLLYQITQNALCSLFPGSSEESLDVCRSRGSRGAERANQRADRKKPSAGAGKQPAEEFSQSRAAGSVSGPSSEWFSTIFHTGSAATNDAGAAAPSTELWTLSVTSKYPVKRSEWSTELRQTTEAITEHDIGGII